MQVMIVFSSWVWLQVWQANVFWYEELGVDQVRGKLVKYECSFDDFFAPDLVVAGVCVLVSDFCVYFLLFIRFGLYESIRVN